MIITANNNFSGYLDLSAMERLKESNPLESIPFRLSIRAGESVTVDDQFRFLHNIQEAIKAGYISISSHTILRFHVGTTPPSNPQINDVWVQI